MFKNKETVFYLFLVMAIREFVIPGKARLGRRPTGVTHSKITRVLVLSWPLPVLPSVHFLTVTKSCHTVTKSCRTKFPMKCDESLFSLSRKSE